ncbi:MAG: hypothetical protein RLZZ592_321 [Pseudomonadota bacterium]|jgi:sigma-E factor negative regulatory protein RseA
MSEPDLSSDRTRARQRLSALMDGDGDRELIAAVCRQWRQDEDDRAQWHAYHLIGDVLRSEDLGRRVQTDAAFLAGVRERLAREPVVLAPLPAEAPAPADMPPVQVAQVVGLPRRHAAGLRLRRWATPVGMAAGVALVAGAVLVTRPGATIGTGMELAQAPQTVTAQPSPAAQPVALRPVEAADASDMQRYVSAHQQFHGGASFGPAPAYLRSASFEIAASR